MSKDKLNWKKPDEVFKPVKNNPKFKEAYKKRKGKNLKAVQDNK